MLVINQVINDFVVNSTNLPGLKEEHNILAPARDRSMNLIGFDLEMCRKTPFRSISGAIKLFK